MGDGWQARRRFSAHARRTTVDVRPQKLETMAEPTTVDNLRDAAGGRFERMRLFLSEVRNELKRVTWPSSREVYATTIVVILVSLFFGLYLALADYTLNSAVLWLFRRFGAA